MKKKLSVKCIGFIWGQHNTVADMSTVAWHVLLPLHFHCVFAVPLTLWLVSCQSQCNRSSRLFFIYHLDLASLSSSAWCASNRCTTTSLLKINRKKEWVWMTDSATGLEKLWTCLILTVAERNYEWEMLSYSQKIARETNKNKHFFADHYHVCAVDS